MPPGADWSQYSAGQWMQNMQTPSMSAGPRGGMWWPPGMQNHMAAMASWYAHQAAVSAVSWNQPPPPQQSLGNGAGSNVYGQHHPSYFQQWRMACPTPGNASFPRTSETGEWVTDANGSMHVPWPGTAHTAPVRPPFKRPPPLVLVRERDKLELKVVAPEQSGTNTIPEGQGRQASAGSSSADEPAAVRAQKNHNTKERLTRTGAVQKGAVMNFQDPSPNSLSPGGTSGGSGEGVVIDSGGPSNAVASTTNTPMERKGSPPLATGQGESSCQRRLENRDWLVEGNEESSGEGEKDQARNSRKECTIPLRPRPRRLEMRAHHQADHKAGVRGNDSEKIHKYPRLGQEGQLSSWRHAIGSAFEAGRGLESQSQNGQEMGEGGGADR